MEEIIEMILNDTNIVVGKTNIPKPQGKPCIILYINKNNENNFLKYSTGKKTISKAEFIGAYRRLLDNKSFTRQWYNENFQKKAATSPCNFTSIGGIFILLGIAKYKIKGCYELIQPKIN